MPTMLLVGASPDCIWPARIVHAADPPRAPPEEPDQPDPTGVASLILCRWDPSSLRTHDLARSTSHVSLAYLLSKRTRSRLSHLRE